MSTLIRPELSETNRYWIEKHRYYELKHFCLQYPLWRHAYNSLIDYPGSWPQLVPPCKTNVVSDPVTKHIDERLYYADRMKMVEQVAKETDEELFKNITANGTYTDTNVTVGVVYYYSAFPYTSTGAYNRSEANRTSVTPKKRDYLFGYDLVKATSSPTGRVTNAHWFGS